MYSEETKSSSLAKFLSIYDYVFVDTCSLMEDSFPVFMDNLTASREYWKDGLHVIVLGECVEELKKHSASKDNQEARIEAKRALKILHHDKWFHKILEVTKSNTNYGFADNAIYTAVSSLRIQNKVLIITQDKTLATDLKKLNSLDSQRGRYVLVYRLNQQGDLEENPGENGVYQARNYSSAPRSTSNTSDRHVRGGFFHKERPVKEKEPVEEKPVADSPIVSADKRLMANLNNPNYPAERKLSDINEQITAIDALPSDEKSKLSLAYTYDELVEERNKLTPKDSAGLSPSQRETAIAHGELPLPAKKTPELKQVGQPVESKKEAPAPVKPVPVAETKPISASKPQHLWFEFGSSVQEALTRTGSHYGVIFRDASVPYFPMVHGPYDLTSKDLDQVAAQVGVLKTGEKKDLPLGPLTAHIEKTEKDYKATIEIPAKTAPIVEQATQTPAPLAESKPARVEEKPVAKVEASAPKTEVKRPRRSPSAKGVTKSSETKVSENKPVSKPVSKSSRKVAPSVKTTSTAPSVTAQDVNTAVPSGATLLVGVPTNDDKRGFIERRARREDTTTLSAVPNPNKGRRVSKTSTAKAPKIVAKGTKPIASDVPEADMAAILKEDKNLNAKINNPNYPVNQKIADLQAQKGKLRRFKLAQQKDLLWSAAKIEAKIKELSPKK